MTVTFKDDLRPLDRAFAGAVKEFAVECQRTFDDDAWSWPATTRRRNGQTVGSPRNLVDLGELKRSQQPPVVTGRQARLAWAADHAAATFLGAVFRKRQYSLPARNLPMYAAKNFDWPAAYARHFK